MRHARKSTKDEPELRDAPSFAQSLSDKALHCRELGHVWQHSTVTWDPAAQVYDRSLVCRSCRSVRRQVLNTRGHVLRNSYNYAAGYLANRVMNRDGLTGRDVFRIEALTRWLEAHNQTPKAG